MIRFGKLFYKFGTIITEKSRKATLPEESLQGILSIKTERQHLRTSDQKHHGKPPLSQIWYVHTAAEV